MRRTSVSLPIKQAPHDPPKKPVTRYRKKPSFFRSLYNAWMTQGQRTRWLKAVSLILVIFLIFYYISPKAIDLHKGLDRNKPSSKNGDAAVPVAPGNGQVPADSSYHTDRCTRSSSKSKPIVQYVIMIDAGSTGSRVHVYKFNNCGNTPELEREDFKMTEKSVGGLSKYKDDPEAAARTLAPLLDLAMQSVPDALKRCTPVAVKATAGLRMVGAEASAKILDAVRNFLDTQYPFPVVSKENDGVAIMDGSLEGVYAWITTNYLLGKIGGPDTSETAAVFDLGGGSTQIVFEPTFKGAAAGGMPEKLAEGDHHYDLEFGGRQFELYQHSHLGYGLMAARDAIHKVFFAEMLKNNPLSMDFTKQALVNPCIAPGMSREVTLKFGENDGKLAGQELIVNMTGPMSPAPAQCRYLAEKILRKDTQCKLMPCSFNGVHQPLLSKTFAREDVYIFSFFYDRTKPLGMPDSFTIRELQELATTVCGGEPHWDVFNGVAGALAELRDRPEYCLDLNFMVALLHTGYEMPMDREVKIAKKIKGNELGWCLGASLPLLAPNSGWKCKVSEIH